MKKIIKIGTAILLLLTFCISEFYVVIAVSNTDFFVTNKEEISKGEILEMTLDISKVEYDKFDFILTSNLDINNISVSEDVKAESYNNEISISIDKSKVKLNKVSFYYQVPENAGVGTQIELFAKIFVEKMNSQENNDITNISDNNQSENDNELSNILNNDLEQMFEEVLSKQITVKITEIKQTEKTDEIQNSNNENKTEKNDNSNFNDAQISNNNTLNNSLNNTMSNNASMAQMSSMNNSNYSGNLINSNSMSIGAQVETAKYNGSNNNYLANLEIEGETLNTTFNKENTTYFIETSEKSELNVNVELEDSAAKAQITGDSNLKTGVNKILISVTAKNGDVRYYRVFVTNK